MENGNTVSAVKYLYRYVYKGHDSAVVEFKSGGETADTADSKCTDEISNYLEGQSVSATEACYHIFSFDLHANLPHVLRLAKNGKTAHYSYGLVCCKSILPYC